MLDILSNSKATAEALDPGLIRTDGGTQMRLELNPATIAEYAETMLAGARFPDIVVYYDGEHYWLGDGFHRLDAHKRAWGSDPTRPTIGAEVRSGTRRDAVLHAAAANANHGLRRTNADKRRAVETLLRDGEWAQWSDREIARACAVDHKTVGNLRRELSGEIPQMPTVRVAYRNGADYAVETSGISAANQERKTDLTQKIRKIEIWLMGRGWGMSSGPAPTPGGIHKGPHSFEWAKDDQQAHFDAVKNAETIEKAAQRAGAITPTVAEPGAVEPLPLTYAETRLMIIEQLKDNENFMEQRRFLLDDMSCWRDWEEHVPAGRTLDKDIFTATQRYILDSIAHNLAEQEQTQATPAEPAVEMSPNERLLHGTPGDRAFVAEMFIRSINSVIDDFGIYGHLTGRFTDIPPARRALEQMRDEMQHLVSILKSS